jgi:hypothetical protein
MDLQTATQIFGVIAFIIICAFYIYKDKKLNNKFADKTTKNK